MMKRAKSMTGLVALVVLVCSPLAVLPASASAAVPAPGLTVVATHAPTDMSGADGGTDEVQEVQVGAEGGTFTLSLEGVETGPIPCDASAATVQAGLEALSNIRTGNVAVSGGPTACEFHAAPWTVTFVGGLSDREVPELVVNKGGLTGRRVRTIVKATAGRSLSEYILHVTNDGGAPTTRAVTLTDKLPGGVTTSATPIAEKWSVSGAGTGWSCSTGAGQTTVSCTLSGSLDPGVEAEPVVIYVTVPKAVEGKRLTNEVEVTGGGATAPAKAGDATTFAEATAPFGVQDFAVNATGKDGAPFTQGGGHPYLLNTSFFFASERNQAGGEDGYPFLPAKGDAEDVRVTLPAGFVGNPLAGARCKQAELPVEHVPDFTNCPSASQVGTVSVYYSNPAEVERHAVYNMVPPPGVPAQLAFSFAGIYQRIDFQLVRANGRYQLQSNSVGISEAYPIFGIALSLWGVPAEASHDAQRFYPASETTGAPAGEAAEPFLSEPTDCAQEAMQPAVWSLQANAWTGLQSEPDAFNALSVQGCEGLSFAPKVGFVPSAGDANTPSAYTFTMEVPQAESPESPSTPDLKDATVTLPEGVVISPSSAGGLQGCSASEIDLASVQAAACPAAAKIGEVTIETPLLEHPLSGPVFLAEPSCGDACTEADAEEGRMVGLYVQAEGSGVRVKLPGTVEVGGSGAFSKKEGLQPGQLRASFAEDPQLPFSKLTLSLKGGARAPLVNPDTCGTFTTTSSLVPWSAPFTPTARPFSHFTIEGCTQATFAPAFTAGTANDHGGSFSPFTMTLTRKDGEQRLSTVSMTLPPGISGMISKVTPCANAAAEAGDCLAASKIGHVVVEAGVGSEPITLPEAGKPEDPVFLTEKYEGAPFGLSIVVPAEAGPFNLGTVIVRAKIEVNPDTAQVSVISNPMPTMLDGIPLDVKAIHVDVNRPDFMFNPTSCEPMNVTGTIGSAEGAAAAVSSHFQAGSCAALAFKPRFSALIHAHHSRKNGEYLHVVLRSKFGEANIGNVHVTLPGKLPARLGAALKNACTVQQFDTNPAGCPAQSVVGHATAHTPILPVPMEGPAIFVSHGGTGFPDLALLLQGDGVHITLIGKTFIHEEKGHRSITTTTFSGVPDVPISRFDLVLPAGSNSALGGNGNMCRRPLYMPTVITGQNGAIVKHRTKLEVTGCKPELSVVGQKAKGRHAHIHVSVPSAGKLVVNGHGIKRTVKRVRKAKIVTVTVHLNRHYRRAAAKRRLKVRVEAELRFKPRHGKALAAHTRLLLR